jgi:hypothetical protein
LCIIKRLTTNPASVDLGLKRSLIVDEHIYIGDSGLTIRDQHVVDLILQMLSHPTHPRGLLALQECSGPFLAELGSKLPHHFAIIAHHGEALLFDRDLFEVVRAEAVFRVFSHEPYRGNSPFFLYSPYCTNISPYVFYSKAIDHFLVYSPEGSAVLLNASDQIVSGLQSMVDLLEESAHITEAQSQ